MGDPFLCLRHLPPPDEGTLLSELVQHQKHLSQRKQHEMVRITGIFFPPYVPSRTNTVRRCQASDLHGDGFHVTTVPLYFPLIRSF